MNFQFEWIGGGLVINVEDFVYFIKWFYIGKVLSIVFYELFCLVVNFCIGQVFDIGYGFGIFVWFNFSGKSYGYSGIMLGYFIYVEYVEKGGYVVVI